MPWARRLFALITLPRYNFQKSKRVGNRTRINEGSVLHCELVLCTMTKNKVQLSVGMHPPFAVERHSPRLEIGAGNSVDQRRKVSYEKKVTNR